MDVNTVKNGHYHIRLFGVRVLAVVCDHITYIPAGVFKVFVGIGVNDFYQSPRIMEMVPIGKLVEQYRIKDIVHSITRFMPLSVAFRELSYNKQIYRTRINNIRDVIEKDKLLYELRRIARKTYEIKFELPESLRDLPDIYPSEEKLIVRPPVEPVPPINNSGNEPAKQVLSLPGCTALETTDTNPFRSSFGSATNCDQASTYTHVGVKRTREEAGLDNDSNTDESESKRRKISNIDALIVISQLETKLNTALLELKKLKQLLN
jgi:hypothetical protein